MDGKESQPVNDGMESPREMNPYAQEKYAKVKQQFALLLWNYCLSLNFKLLTIQLPFYLLFEFNDGMESPREDMTKVKKFILKFEDKSQEIFFKVWRQKSSNFFEVLLGLYL